MSQPHRTSSPETIIQQLTKILDVKAIHVDDQWATSCSKSPEPVVVVDPATESELCQVLRLADESDWNVSPSGACTKRGFGSLMDTVQVVVRSSKMNQIIDYSPSDLVVTVQAGMPLQALQTVLSEQRQMLPIDPVCHPDSTVGGVVSTGITGPLRNLYGTLRDMTIGLRTVYPDGQLVKTGGKVVKNVAGYDMTKLFVGALGTLAFVSEVTFKLRPLPAYTELCLLSGGASDVQRAIAQVIDSHLIPSRMEALCGPWTAGPLVPSVGDDNIWTLAIECHESERGSAYQSQVLARFASASNLTCEVIQGERVPTFWRAYKSVLWDAALRVRYTAPPNQVIPCSERLAQWLMRKDPSARFSVTPSAGVARMFAWNLTLEEQAEFVFAIRDTVRGLGGIAVIENGSAALRRLVDAFGATPDESLLHGRIKRAIDPKGAFNPGRFLEGV